jgi:serine phosphatase RsbU (regulator of sigma subunit)
VREFGLSDPGKILAKANALVEESFPSGKGNVKDGMDIALCAVNSEMNDIFFAGANNPLWIIRNNEIIEIKADQMPIGWFKKEITFNTQNTDIRKGDVLYLFTDGYTDQFGGPNGKKFKTVRLRSLLIEIHQKPMAEQRRILRENFESWKQMRDQIDDICVMGIRI